ncbi:MAG: nickel ABC transporter ATP-binding protein NikE [Thermoleophilia bacterium]
MSPPALVARGLRVQGPDGARLVDDVGFSVAAGEVLAVVGGSGAGKTLAALALIGLVPPPARHAGGAVELDGVPVPAGGEALRRVRGAGIALVPQDPAAALDPVRRVGEQVAETIRAHRPMGRGEARARAAAALAEVGVVRDDHPHRLSGGQRQRALIAMALAPGPRVLVADEPTASLDAPVQVEVLDLLDRRRREGGLAVVLVTHDLGAVARIADRVVVMDAGQVVEEGPARQVLAAPRHPATAALVAAVPRPRAVPRLAPAGPPLLEARGVVRVHRARSGEVRALDGADLAVGEGEVVGLVGASGSGKTTLGRMMVRLDRPSEGAVTVGGRDLAALDPDGLRAARRTVQMVFQDPYLSLDPRLSVGAAIAEPMRIHGLGGSSRAERRASEAARVPELMEVVGLDPGLASRRPATLSGGQRQRVALARALALEPRALVLDEPVSSLDPATGARVLAVLDELRQRRGLSYLLISHDLAAVAAQADRVAVMDAGRIVEAGPPPRLLAAPGHPATRALARAAQDLSLVPWS